jgi:hypothetical protein
MVKWGLWIVFFRDVPGRRHPLTQFSLHSAKGGLTVHAQNNKIHKPLLPCFNECI